MEQESPKPDSCKGCRFYWKPTKGFCGDFQRTEDPRIAIMLYRPGHDAAVMGDPWMSGSAKKLMWDLGKLGFKKEDVLLTHLIRCYFPIPDKRGIPVKENKHGIEMCRQYDAALKKWNPNAVIYTYDLESRPPFTVVNELALQKAKNLADMGMRPIVSFGTECLSFLNPQLQGGLNTWALHMDLGYSWHGA